MVRGHFGASISRRRHVLLITAGSFYVVVGAIVFLLAISQTAYDKIMLFMYPPNVTDVATNASAYCG